MKIPRIWSFVVFLVGTAFGALAMNVSANMLSNEITSWLDGMRPDVRRYVNPSAYKILDNATVTLGLADGLAATRVAERRSLYQAPSVDLERAVALGVPEAKYVLGLLLCVGRSDFIPRDPARGLILLGEASNYGLRDVGAACRYCGN